jgi:hypothetical protein
MKKSKQNRIDYRKTAFIDSNLLIYLSLLFDYCDRIGCNPDTNDLFNEAELLKAGVKKSLFEKKYLQAAQKHFKYLNGLANDQYQILSSTFCKLEFLHLLFERKAHANLLDNGVPVRLRQRKYGLLYMTCLDPKDYETATIYADEFIKKLLSFGIEINFMPDIESLTDIAQIIMGVTPIDIQDAIVYASAINSEADELLTADAEFKTIINNLENPLEEPWKSNAASLIKRIKDVKYSVSEVDDFALPKSPT